MASTDDKGRYNGPELGDWRDRYVICEHIADLPKDGDSASTEGTRHNAMRVCCEECYPGFLFPEDE